jgi:hypothetical protein
VEQIVIYTLNALIQFILHLSNKNPCHENGNKGAVMN